MCFCLLLLSYVLFASWGNDLALWSSLPSLFAWMEFLRCRTIKKENRGLPFDSFDVVLHSFGLFHVFFRVSSLLPLAAFAMHWHVFVLLCPSSHSLYCFNFGGLSYLVTSSLSSGHNFSSCCTLFGALFFMYIEVFAFWCWTLT